MNDHIQKTDGRKKGSGGRPFKFAEPSRAITLTLPESTLRDLEEIGPDRGHAIVKLTQIALGGKQADRPMVELVKMGANTGLVVIGPSPALRRIEFVQLVEIAPGRHLIALAHGRDFRELEIALIDLLDDLSEARAEERDLIRQLLGYLKNFRKSESVSMAQIVLVRL
jgi:hypothetical protein